MKQNVIFHLVKVFSKFPLLPRNSCHINNQCQFMRYEEMWDFGKSEKFGENEIMWERRLGPGGENYSQVGALLYRYIDSEQVV